MRPKGIPFTAIAVFGVSALIAGAVAIAIWLGVGSARRTTAALLVEKAQTLIDTMETTIEGRLRPVVDQSEWVRQQVETGGLDVADDAALDIFMRGTFAGTPEVTGIAVVWPDGRSRRWGRDDPTPVEEDWSSREPIKDWLASGQSRQDGTWEQPFWTPTLNDTVVLHDQPLTRHGEFIAMLGQVVPVSGLSRLLMSSHARSGLVPFVLYGRDRVLAHPLLAEYRGEAREDSTALTPLEDLGDAVLARIWSPDEERLDLLERLEDARATLVRHRGVEYVFLYKSFSGYGPQPWVLGVYLDTREYGEREVQRVILAASGGIAVMLVAVLLAMVGGLRVSRRLAALSAAAHAVQMGDLDAADGLGHSGIREIDQAMRAFGQMVEGLRERQLIRSTLGRFVPEPVARSLLGAGGQLEPRETAATILFCDIEHFTALTESRGPQGIVALLNAFFSDMVEILERHGGIVTQFQGDAILATFNVPVADPNHAGNGLRAALEMQQHVRTRNYGGETISIRIGVNTGAVVAGAVGANDRLSYTVHGDAVNLAARLEEMNKTFGTRILASATTVAEVAGFDVTLMGETTARGQTRSVAVYAVTAGPGP